MSPSVQNKTRAEVYAAVVGVVLVLAGIIGFLYSGGFGVQGRLRAACRRWSSGYENRLIAAVLNPCPG